MTIDTSKLKQLKQLPFNANSDNLIRILCDIFDEVSDNITALSGEVVTGVNFSRNTENDSVYIQLMKENETTVTSATLPIECWETLDISNLPTNFTDGTELMITFLSSVNSQTATDWNTAVESNPTVGNQTGENTIRVKLKTGTTQSAYLQSIQVDSTAVTGCQVMIESVPNWNNTNNSIITIIPFAFNGAGLQEGVGISVLRSNITTYIESIKRKL